MHPELILGLAVGLSILCFFLGSRLSAEPAQAGDQLERYLLDSAPDAVPGYMVGNNPTQSTFVERVITPAWQALLERLGGLAPQRNVDALAKRLETAGRPNGLTVLNFLGLKFIVAPALGFTGLLLSVQLLRQPVAMAVVVVSVFAVLGFYLPDLMLTMAIQTRQREILRALPDALDMIVVSIEAGQGLDQALKRVSERWRNPLTEEFRRVITEMALGRTRREALTAASDRIQLADLSSLITAIVQADQLGVSIGQVLRAQAEQLRTVRRQRAEALAREAAIKLLFPLVFLIFPAMFAVLLGPAVPLLLETITRF